MSGAVVAAAAAAAALMREEEEELTQYNEEELQDDWEFKILRSYTSAFKSQELFRQICQEEAQAGWIFVEKFDNSRIRFKRPASAKENDRRLNFDPYRTTCGMSSNAVAGLTVGIIIAFFLTLILLAVMFG